FCSTVVNRPVYLNSSAKVASLLKMPQTNKFKSAAASSAAQSAGPDRGEALRDPNAPPGDSDGDDNQGDPQIIKSPSDPKQYRYIELSSGLRALLISDLSGLDGNAEDEDDEDSEEEEEEAEAEVEEEEGDSGEGTDEECEEEGDSQDSDFEELDEDNERKKKKGSEKQSAAALCIGVGSFSDPSDLPGLAHFLEHMVFMGSEKYPSENGFDAFLKKHGGSDNASTDCERTIFQFDVQRKHFKEALDRWAQFFICPLMIEDAIDREVEAVDSEYQLAKPSDSHRKEMLFGSLAKPNHPMSKFCWGNAQTLKTEPKEKNINVYKRLREFWKRYYSAHYMTLAVQSKESLDTLEEWVREIFSQVPNNGQPKPDFSDQLSPFETPAFNKLYRVVPVRKVHALTITWALPPQEKHYRVKPLHYIAWLIGHEGTGSILSLLRRKCWALALFGGNSETGFDQNTTYSIFSISITLTDEGFQNFYEVAHLVFQYLKMLQTLGPQQRIYEEIQKIEANEFHYQEQTDPIEYVEDICENMQLFPKQDFLTGDQLMFEFKPEVISAALNLLTPEKANLLLLSPEHEGQCPLKEKWFGTQYSVEDIQQHWRELWAGDFDLNPSLHLPAENKFIATDFALKTSDCPDTEYPVRIMNNDRVCLWYKKDNKFKIPKGVVVFVSTLNISLIQKSPKNLVLFDLFVNILVHNLAEPAYEADVAQLEYKLVAGEHGLVIKVKGFNHKLPLLFNLIVDYLADFSAAPDVFSMFAEQLKKTYFNILIKPEKLGKDVRLLILEHSRWSTIQKYQAVLDGLSVDELMEFVSSFKSELYAEGLVQGNFTSTESMGFLQYVTNKLQFKKLSVEVPVLFRVVELPQKHHLCKVKSLNKGDANSEVTVYFQVTALVKLKGCEDTHLGEEVDRNWTEVVTQQYVFDRLSREIDALKLMTKAELVNWYMEHRGQGNRKLSVHVKEEEEGSKMSLYGEVSKLTFLSASTLMASATTITDIRAFTSTLNLYPYHKILK
uniref:Nardilysin a (N-arginine dibasic convertase) n=1 Tax=Cyprinus carpio TaxID=7962 RepID=A0A8C2GCF4_CYPCA